MAPGTPVLVERDNELTCLDALAERALGGTGGAAVVEGPAGIGKSGLLAETRRRAEQRGVQVFSARGVVLERQVGFGVVRQLFALPLARCLERERRRLFSGVARHCAHVLGLEPADEGSPPTPVSEIDLHHALYWLCANLADQCPVVIVVDDAHWADLSSLRWVAYLARRLEDLAVFVVVSIRSSEPESALPPLAELRADANTVTLRPRPLSQRAVADVVHRLYRVAPDEEFARACTEATGGNPFFVQVLARTAIDEGLPPTADCARRLEHLVPSEVTEAILARIARLPSRPLALAQTVAVMGGSGELRHVAALAAMDEARAATAADELVGADLLRPGPPLEFTHPLVGRAVYATIPPFERRLAHRQAALLLDAEGQPAETVAAQLLEGEAVADAWAVEALRRAAATAASTAAPDTAVAYLRRALAEPPPNHALGQVLAELGSLEARVGDPQAVEHLTRALNAVVEPSERVQLVVTLSQVQALAGRPDEAVTLLRQTLDESTGLDRELQLAIEAELLAIVQHMGSGRGVIAERLEHISREVARGGRTPAERRLLAFLAQESLFANEPADRVAELAQWALGGGRLLDEETAESPLYFFPVDALSHSGQFELADAVLDETLRDARARGSAAAFCHTALSRCALHRQRGAIRSLEGEAAAGLDAAVVLKWSLYQPVFGAYLAEALIERGELEAAKEVLGDIPFAGSPAAYFLLGCRGRLNLEMGRTEQALEDLFGSGRHQLSIGIVTPAVYPWRSVAALALARLGDLEQARSLAAEELALAQAFGSPRTIGVALRSAALVEPDEERKIEHLRRAEHVLHSSEAPLELSRTRADLGAVLRRAGMRNEARALLEKALDTAHHCGATALVQRCWAELSAAGARPRRASRSGVDALTPSELRVAQLASEGLTTREIAQSLFVSRKTVEKHLGQVYSKLGVHSREELRRNASALLPTALEGRPRSARWPAGTR